jgi:sulfide:quinone oxidoreductase
MNIRILAEDFAISSQVSPGDVTTIAAAGYRAVVCNRPDGEEALQPAAHEVEAACDEHGIDFHYLPFSGAELPAGLIESFRSALTDADGPVLAYCRSGQRCIYLWAATAAAGGPPRDDP